MKVSHQFLLRHCLFVLMMTDKLFGLKCKQGFEVRPTGEEGNDPEQCPNEPDAQYCAATICKTDEIPGFASIFWKCVADQNGEECAKTYKMGLEKEPSGLKNVTCECFYGEKGEDNGNAKYVLQPVSSDPEERGLMCKVGWMDSVRRGNVQRWLCPRGFRYCYATNCTNNADQKLAYVVWGCAPNADDAFCKVNEENLEHKLSESMKMDLTCQCLFGRRGVSYANEDFMMDFVFPEVIY